MSKYQYKLETELKSHWFESMDDAVEFLLDKSLEEISDVKRNYWYTLVSLNTGSAVFKVCIDGSSLIIETP